ncbi:hypothetical protein FSP39_000481 [Pinctada imbricata]|uniref:AAA+ ATPase domain-containing protein n=1 Tax=Pinctada imbricata TaxID=66713 RepID=A0AA88XSZ4_PINIB|nr:hypothetical protein FSP39_000481 [Pinctada imbricata]
MQIVTDLIYNRNKSQQRVSERDGASESVRRPILFIESWSSTILLIRRHRRASWLSTPDYLPCYIVHSQSVRVLCLDPQPGPDVQSSTVTFADIGGNEETLMDICKLLVHMKHPEVYKQLGVTPPRGFLLHGPPGCGKTLLANAIAGELSLPLIKIAATEVVSGVSGESEEKVRELFEKATAAAPCVLFIDEIDAITPKRETASKDMERRIVAQLLSCMDDLNNQVDAPVLVIGATNRPDSLDPALRRAGRFDREISLGIPDEAARGRILQVLCRGLRLEEKFDYDYLAKNTPGYVGADLMALTREAAMTAVNRVFHELQNPPIKSMIPVTENDNSKQPSRDKTTSDKSASDVIPSDKSTSEETPDEKISSDKKGEETAIESAPSACNENKVSSQEENKSTSETVTVNGTDESSECKNCDSAENSEPVVLLNGETKDSSNVSKSDIIEIDSTSECRKNSGSNEDVDKNIQTNNSICSMDVSEEIPSTSGASQEVSTPNPEREGVKSVLDWLKDYPPLNEEQLQKLRIMLQDFKEALKFVQPSAKREGFATIPDVTWDDIGALHSVREELQLAIMAPVRHAQEFKDLGLTQAQGILLAGPPGCGKTLLAKAIANESGINFISVKGPELLNMYVGESERAVRQVFQRGRNSAPCVIFFDELDALCPKRSLSGESGSSVRVVNQLLTEMDGLEERRQVFIMAATNRPDIIDPAILRPGRLDKLLYVGLPSPADRLDILQTITKKGTKPKLASDVSLEDVSNDDRCNGFTGADLAALVREASVCALKSIIKSPTADKSSPQVSKQHFEEAFTKVKPSVSQQLKKILTIISTALTIEHKTEHRRTPSKLEVGPGVLEE